MVNNRRYRSFAEADVNTVITVARRREAERLTGRTAFTPIDVPYDVVSTPSVMRDALVERGSRGRRLPGRGAGTGDDRRTATVVVDEASLWRLGGGSVSSLQGDHTPRPRGSYSGGSWGQFVRAPDVYYGTMERYGE